MQPKLNLLPAVFFLYFFVVSSAMAQNTLLEPEIEQYISTLPELLQLPTNENDYDSRKIGETSPSAFGNKSTFTPVSDNLEFLRTQSNYPEFIAILRKHGYTNPEEWASTGDKIMSAYSAYYLKNKPDSEAPSLQEIIEDLQDQITKVENNPFISSEQKQTLLNNLQNSVAILKDPNYIESENISIIGPYIGRLDSLFKELQ